MLKIDGCYGEWLVLDFAGMRGNRQSYYRCRCSCGTERDVRGTALATGASLSCGCLTRWVNRRRGTVHGHAAPRRRTRTYRTWESMIRRCSSPVSRDYPRYGGRGISVCDRWRDYVRFLEDMGERPAGRSLDRIDNDGNYGPENCRWATPAEQIANRGRREG